jgi:6-phosphogluconolactonase
MWFAKWDRASLSLLRSGEGIADAGADHFHLAFRFQGKDNSAEIEVGRSGRFLYASNRGQRQHHGICHRSQQGTLTKVQVAPTQGKIPRNFAIDPTGKYLVAGNQKSQPDGCLCRGSNERPVEAGGAGSGCCGPVSILFVPAE